jgi:hypothetical protein
MILFPATPFALSPFIQNNLQHIQDMKHFLNENKNIRDNK